MRRLFLALLAAASCASAQDLEREQRWAAEIVPNLVVGDAVRLKLPSGREFLGLYTEASASKPAVLLVHGIGVHPDFGVVGALRASLADLGYPTLSIQMPVLKSDATSADYFPALFPEAAARIQVGADWLAAKGHARSVLLSHSLGSWMANVYYERTPDPPFAAWVCIGLTTGGYGRMGNVKVPLLDIYGEKDFPQVLRGEWRRALTVQGIPSSAQVKVSGADHHFTGREKELAAAVHDFLSRLK